MVYRVVIFMVKLLIIAVLFTCVTFSYFFWVIWRDFYVMMRTAATIIVHEWKEY